MQYLITISLSTPTSKDGDITDDEVVKEEKECNSDESSTEDIKQETYNEEDKNELLKCEMSMQQQGNGTVLADIAANTQEELAEDAEDSSEPTGLEQTHSQSLLPRSLSTQKKHLEIRKKADAAYLKAIEKMGQKYSKHNGHHIKQFAVGDNVSV